MERAEKNFYKLIEIAVTLSPLLERQRVFPSPSTKKQIYCMEKRMKEWLEKYYEDPGIKPGMEARILFDKESQYT